MIFFFALTLSYILFLRKKFDFFSIAMLSSMLYFFPSLLGYVWYIDNGVGVFVDIDRNVYIIQALVIAALIISSVFFDYVLIKPIGPSLGIKKDGRVISDKRFETFSFAVCAAAYILFALLNFNEIVTGDKAGYDRTYSIAAVAVPYGLTVSFLSKRYWWSALFASALLIDLYGGNREILVFSSIVIGLITIGRITTRRLRSYYKYVPLFLVPMLFALVYKGVGAAMISGRLDLVWMRITDANYYINSVIRSEPFVTQAILNYTILYDYSHSYSVAEYTKGILVAFVPFADIFGSDQGNILGYIKNALFPLVDYGVASNIWAEAYVVGGYHLVVFYIILYAITPIFLNRLMESSQRLDFKVIVALCGVVVVFFVHRSGAEYAITLVKRFIMLYVFMRLLWIFIDRSRGDRRAGLPFHNRPQHRWR